MDGEEDLIVLRFGADEDVPENVRARVDGLWIDKSRITQAVPVDAVHVKSGASIEWSARPTGEFEVRESDGRIAEVYRMTRKVVDG